MDDEKGAVDPKRPMEEDMPSQELLQKMNGYTFVVSSLWLLHFTDANNCCVLQDL